MIDKLSEYVHFPGGNLVASARPEGPKADPAADQLTHAELLRQFKWTDDDLATASCCGFPNARYQIFGVFGGREVRWSRREVNLWLERIRGLKIR
jgi:hypothetical protein